MAAGVTFTKLITAQSLSDLVKRAVNVIVADARTSVGNVDWATRDRWHALARAAVAETGAVPAKLEETK